MSKDQSLDNPQVFVELSVIPLENDGEIEDQIDEMLSDLAKGRLIKQDASKGYWVEGSWDEVFSLIKICYARANELSPKSYLRAAIR
jgi:uncharacterized protein YqgV (UPF0045/DUF77 family)